MKPGLTSAALAALLLTTAAALSAAAWVMRDTHGPAQPAHSGKGIQPAGGTAVSTVSAEKQDDRR